MKLYYQPAHVLRSLIEAAEVSCLEVMRAHLDRVDRGNTTLNAIVAMHPREQLEEQARLADDVPAPYRGILHGIPVLIKDNIETTDLPTTYGSRAFEGNVSDFEALIVTRLRHAGAIIVGKTSTPEWAVQHATSNEIHGTTPNPWNLTRTSGGSSGGAAAAVAAGFGPMAQGNDGAGSIRWPASCCGIVGLKPSRGRVPWAPRAYECWNGIATNGPMASDVADVALMLDVMAGPVLGEPYSIRPPRTTFSEAAREDPKRLRIGVLVDAPGHPTDKEVMSAVHGSGEILQEMGHYVDLATFSFEGFQEPLMTIVRTNCAADLAQLGIEENLDAFGANVRDLVGGGRQIAGTEFACALRDMQMHSARLSQLWETFDVLLTPTATVTPFEADGPEYVEEYMHYFPFLYAFNMTGQPAISVPYGLTAADGVPIGVQLVGRPGGDEELLAVASALEHAGTWAGQRPPDQW